MLEYEKPEEVIRELKGHYRSGLSSLANDFFSPCIRYCMKYERAAGYFSSTALLSWLDILPKLSTSDGLSIQLIISPNLSEEDLQALINAQDEQARVRIEEKITELMMNKTLDSLLSSYDKKTRLDFFTWLVSKGHLVLKFAFPEHVDAPGIFHEKIGIFYFPWGDEVAFIGSANETLGGYKTNYESIDVYRSWITSESERVKIKEQQFEEAWQGNASGLRVAGLTKAILDRINIMAPEKRPEEKKVIKIREGEADEPNQWAHQDEAVSRFLDVKRGVLEMATGTGKTKTAFKIIDKLIGQGLIDSVIITTTGTDLLDQWSRQMDQWSLNQKTPYRIFRHYEANHDILKYCLDYRNAAVVVSREQLYLLFKQLSREARQRIIIVHDEVHGLGSPSMVSKLSGEHSYFGHCLGLSATPEREYDDAGNEFIAKEIGDAFYKFDLKDAIEKGILCEFDYIPLKYELTENDKRRIQMVYLKKAMRAKEGNPMTDEEVWIEIARVYKTAEQKPGIFYEYLKERPSMLKSAIIFVETKEYGLNILRYIQEFTYSYRTYYAEDDREHLKEFSRGEINCLITCHRISQGIDIKQIRCIVLFSSSRSKLETIQRIGRCLRFDPDDPSKRSLIIDFVRDIEDDEENNSDSERCEWLTGLSKVRRIL